MGSRLVTTLVGLSLLVPAWMGLFSSGVPTLYAPLPTLTILPAFLLSSWHLESFAVLIPTILFFLWNPGLFNGQGNLPRRTIALLVVLSGLTVADFIFEWHYGIQYRGWRHTIALYMIDVVWLALLYLGALRTLRRPSFKATLFLHWLLFAWLAWYAFPYLGELP